MRIPYRVANKFKEENMKDMKWKLSDGSELLTHVMVDYCVPMFHEFWDDAFDKWRNSPNRVRLLLDEIERRRPGYNTGNFLLPVGCDFSFEHGEQMFDAIDPVLDEMNEDPSITGNYTFSYKLVSDYMSEISKHNLKTYSGDLMPYSDKPHAYWSGYYTSYPSVKKQARRAETTLRLCNIVYTQTYGGSHEEQMHQALEQLRTAVGDITHHDGITGTSKERVNREYYLPTLEKAITTCENEILKAIGKLIKASTMEQTIGSFNQSALVVYNSLSWKQEQQIVHVRVQNQVDSICVFDGKKKLDSQLLEIPTSLEKDSKEFVFMANVPALGYETYFIDTSCESEINAPIVQTEEFSISNEVTSLKFCKAGDHMRLCSHKSGNVEMELNQQVLAYEGYSAWGQDEQPSGAYIFRPKTTQAAPLFTITSTRVQRGPICERVVQVLSGYMTQIFTICKGQDYFELETIIGGEELPDGKEIVTQFSSGDIHNDQVLYCDKNGIETRRFEYSKEGDDTERLAGSFLPMVSACYIVDKRAAKSNTRLTLVTSQPQGVSATAKSGTMEVMIFRKTEMDDKRGVSEPLRDTQEYSFTMRVYIDKVDTPTTKDLLTSAYTNASLQLNNPVFTAVVGLHEKENIQDAITEYEASHTMKKSAVEFDSNVHLLSWDTVIDRDSSISKVDETTRTVLRLQHLGHTSDDQTVSLVDLLDKQKLVHETQLSTARRIGDQPTNNIVLKPNQIRTFVSVQQDKVDAYKKRLEEIESDTYVKYVTEKPTTTTKGPTTTRAPTTTTTQAPTSTKVVRPTRTPRPTKPKATKKPITTTTRAPDTTFVPVITPQYSFSQSFSNILLVVAIVSMVGITIVILCFAIAGPSTDASLPQ